MSLLFSPDGKKIIAGRQNGTIVFWDTPAVGLEEGVKVWTAEQLKEAVKDLPAGFVPEGISHVALFPVDAAEARLDGLAMDLYVHADVEEEAMMLLSGLVARGAQIEHVFNLPSDPVEANLVLERAAQSGVSGRNVIVALNQQLRGQLQLPPNHPVTLLLSVTQRSAIDPAQLAFFLSQPGMLANLILDLTAGTIRTVTIDGRDYYALFA